VQVGRDSYSLRDGRSGYRVPVGGGARFSAPVQTDTEVHPSSYTMGTGFLPILPILHTGLYIDGTRIRRTSGWSGNAETGQCSCGFGKLWDSVKADSHIACRAHAVPLQSHAAKGLECLSHLIYTVRPCLIHTCHSHAMLSPCRSSQGHGTACPSRDGLWVTCPRSASSGYHAKFHEDCYQKHTNPPHNDPYLRL
jgi:hypothetical protein